MRFTIVVPMPAVRDMSEEDVILIAAAQLLVVYILICNRQDLAILALQLM